MPIIGCHSHLLNLAIHRYLSTHDDLLSLVRRLVLKCRTTKNLAHLRHLMETNHPNLAFVVPILDNETRWSSKYHMLERYVRLRALILSLKEHLGGSADCIEHLVPNNAQHIRIVALLADLQELDGVTVLLQRKNCTMLMARNAFDTILEANNGKYKESMKHHLAADSPLIQNRPFLDGIVKIMKGDQDLLSVAEAQAMKPFLIEVTDLTADEVAVQPVAPRLSMADSIDRDTQADTVKARISSTKDRYIDLSFINPTSVDTERLFSEAKLTNTDLRQSMTPRNLEARLFLRNNSRYWNLATMLQVLKDQKQSKVELEMVDY